MGALVLPLRIGPAGAPPPLRLLQTLPLPGVHGRLDHLGIDRSGHRLFIAALGNNSVEIVDLVRGSRIQSLRGFNEPQGIVYLPDRRAVAVAEGGGDVTILEGATLGTRHRIRVGTDCDNIRYDPASHRLYVGYGEGAVAVIDAVHSTVVGRIPLPGHPESLQLDVASNRLLVNVPAERAVFVSDLRTNAVVGRWSIGSGRNFPMALDASGSRVFVATRSPDLIQVLDLGTGRLLASIVSAGDADDLFHDPRSRRILVSGGEGVVAVVEENGTNGFHELGRIETGAGARTSLLVPEEGRLYLAIPARNGRDAEVRVYAVKP